MLDIREAVMDKIDPISAFIGLKSTRSMGAYRKDT
jgi:hypothetical protein